VRCPHFDSGACRSCTLLDLPRPRQLAEGRARVEQLLAAHLAPGTVWAAPIVGPEAGFRARGKMAVGGTAAAPVLTLPGQSAGTDLCDCPLYPAGVEQILEGAKALIRRAQVPPYDVARRRGEIKNVLVTASPEGEHLLRLVLRSERALDRLREHLPRLLEDHPSLVGITAQARVRQTTPVRARARTQIRARARVPCTVRAAAGRSASGTSTAGSADSPCTSPGRCRTRRSPASRSPRRPSRVHGRRRRPPGSRTPPSSPTMPPPGRSPRPTGRRARPTSRW